ncbi:MAG: hypothetical protein U1F36_00550 [Planctomycetota bacterium]
MSRPSPLRIRSILGAMLLASTLLRAQSLPRFHALQVEETQVDWTVEHAVGFNARGSFTYYSTNGDFVRYSNGTVQSLAPDQLGDYQSYTGGGIDDLDRVLVTQLVHPVPGSTIGRAALRHPDGSITQLQPYSESHWNEVETSGAKLGHAGHLISGQRWHFDAQYQLVLIAGSLVWGYFCQGLVTNLLQYSGLPSSAQVFWMSGRPNAFGERGCLVLEQVPGGQNYRIYRLTSSAQYIPMYSVLPTAIPAGGGSAQFNDRREFSVLAADPALGPNVYSGTCVFQPDGTSRFLNSKANGNMGVNLEGIGLGQTPYTPPSGGAGFIYRWTQTLPTQAFAMLDGLLDDNAGYRLQPAAMAGPLFINDAGQILAPGYNPSGAPRYLLLHPRVAPVLALDIPTSRRNAQARHDVSVEQDGTILVRIVGGEPGQYGALFLRLGASIFYIENTLAIFDPEQTLEIRLPIPASVRGASLDLLAASLDSTYSILTSLDLRITLN